VHALHAAPPEVRHILRLSGRAGSTDTRVLLSAGARVAIYLLARGRGARRTARRSASAARCVLANASVSTCTRVQSVES
jgi:hypothetical protein